MGTGKRLNQTRLAVENLGLYGFQLQDLMGRMRRSWLLPTLSAQEVDAAVAWFEARSALRSGAGPHFGAAAGRNLLVVQAEALQRFVIGLEIEGREITPRLNSLLDSALFFSRVQDQTDQGRSSAADFVNLTSLLPVGESVAYDYPSNSYTTFAGVLAERGYATLSAIPFRRSFWNRHVTMPSYGFQTTLFGPDFEPGERIGWGLNDRDFLLQMLERLPGLPRPFCAFLMPLSLHYPYGHFPQELKRIDLGRWEGTALGNYLHGMNFFDRAVGELLDGLERSGLLAETLVVVWGDHGSGLQRPETRDLAERFFGGFERLHRFRLDRVPVIVLAPGADIPRGEIQRVAGQVDLAPTLLALLLSLIHI